MEKQVTAWGRSSSFGEWSTVAKWVAALRLPLRRNSESNYSQEGASRAPDSPTVLPMDSSGAQRRPVAKHRCRVTDADWALSAGGRRGSRRDEPAAGAHSPVPNDGLLPRRSGVEAKHRTEGFPNCHLVHLRSSPECDGPKDASFL